MGTHALHPPRPTSKDIAHLAGVSQATVSNVLNRPHLVAETTLAQVRTSMAAAGYVVNHSARTLKSGLNPAIGVVVLDVANPFWGLVVQGIESVTAPRRIPLVIGSSNACADTEQQILQSFESQGVRNVLIAPTGPNLPLLHALQQRGLRVALLGRKDPARRLPAVSLDHAAGAAAVARFLVEAGHRRLAIVNGSHAISGCASRAQGFRAALDTDLELHELQMQSMSAEEGLRSVPQLLALSPRPTAVFCANDMLALGVLKGLARAGVSVPEHLSVVGYDDAPFAKLLSPALTTVHQSAGAIGRRAAALMLAEPHDALPLPRLVVRESARAWSAVPA